MPVSSHPAGDLAAELSDLLREIASQEQSEPADEVDYGSLRESLRYREFRRSTARLRTYDPLALPSRQDQLAFWLNLYNTLVLDGVIALDIRRSVREQRGGKFFRQVAYEVGGQRVSCDDIEHGILRANRGHPSHPGPHFPSSDHRWRWIIEPFDVRIHFALNCASRSCPPIRVYSPERLDAQLALATRSFLAVDTEIQPEDNALTVSSLFKWYSTDFGGSQGIVQFIRSNLPEGAEREWLAGPGRSARLRYRPYDWTLNGTV